MVKLSKSELARQTRPEYYYLDDGDRLGDLVEKYGADAYLDVVYDYSDTAIRIVQHREETDEEYNTRIGNIRKAKIAEAERKKAAKQKKDNEERVLYEKLKAKFG